MLFFQVCGHQFDAVLRGPKFIDLLRCTIINLKPQPSPGFLFELACPNRQPQGVAPLSSFLGSRLRKPKAVMQLFYGKMPDCGRDFLAFYYTLVSCFVNAILARQTGHWATSCFRCSLRKRWVTQSNAHMKDALPCRHREFLAWIWWWPCLKHVGRSAPFHWSTRRMILSLSSKSMITTDSMTCKTCQLNFRDE